MFESVPREKWVYETSNGLQVCGDSKEILSYIPEGTIDLIVTSPPFALLRQKSYGNQTQSEYVDWLMGFGAEVFRVLKSSGSFVLDLGGAYQKGRPVRSLYNFRVLIRFCDELGFRLAEEFYWFNPAKLPSPIEWVNKRKIRVKDAVNTVWWFSKSDFPKADVTRVLKPYSDRMKTLLKDPQSFYRPKMRPSGHDIGANFGNTRNGGAIPPNLLAIPNTDSNSHYMRTCKMLKRKSHPARFPEELPGFFVKYLTDPNDYVVDIFSGSNTTGLVCEKLGRQWLAIDSRVDYAALSGIRFMEGWGLERIESCVEQMERGECVNLTELPEYEKTLFDVGQTCE
ncbi:MAG: site-specific DNA-methyltransferase [Phycisphaerae bacterium]|nr:site-specific DNA-methyltransferase [Phycisphaerae bacterium]